MSYAASSATGADEGVPGQIAYLRDRRPRRLGSGAADRQHRIAKEKRCFEARPMAVAEPEIDVGLVGRQLVRPDR